MNATHLSDATPAICHCYLIADDTLHIYSQRSKPCSLGTMPLAWPGNRLAMQHHLGEGLAEVWMEVLQEFRSDVPTGMALHG